MTSRARESCCRLATGRPEYRRERNNFLTIDPGASYHRFVRCSNDVDAWWPTGTVVGKAPATCRDDELGSLELAPPTALISVNGRANGPVLPPRTDPPKRDSSVDAKGGSAAREPARSAQRRSPGTSPDERSASWAFDSDPGLVVPVIASPEEVLRARELREQLKKEYLDHPGRPCLPWCVGAD